MKQSFFLILVNLCLFIVVAVISSAQPSVGCYRFRYFFFLFYFYVVLYFISFDCSTMYCTVEFFIILKIRLFCFFTVVVVILRLLLLFYLGCSNLLHLSITVLPSIFRKMPGQTINTKHFFWQRCLPD